MLLNKSVQPFFQGPEFELMFNIVGQNDKKSFKNNYQWLRHYPATAIIFSESNNTWTWIRSP